MRRIFWAQVILVGATLLVLFPLARPSQNPQEFFELLSFLALIMMPFWYLNFRLQYKTLKKDQEETERIYWEAAMPTSVFFCNTHSRLSFLQSD